MGKFVNPKKIKGQDKLNRIKDLMGKMNTLTESTSLSELELVKKGPNGVVYGIIRENRNYFIKTSTKTTGELNSNDFDYVGGLQNKGTEKYNSYAEALKHLNMKFDMLNESFGVENNVNLFETDGNAIAGGAGFGFVLPEMEGKDEEIIADQKTVLNVDVPKSEEPVEDEVEMDVDVEEDPFGDDETMEVDAEVEEEGGEDEGDGYTKKIQKLTGKIGQMLRDKDEPDAELDKYVINSIVSAIDWEEIPDEDVEDIIAKIEGEDEEDDALEGGDEVEMDAEVEVEEDPFAEEGGEEELAESDEKGVEEKDCKTLIKQLTKAIQHLELMDMMPKPAKDNTDIKTPQVQLPKELESQAVNILQWHKDELKKVKKECNKAEKKVNETEEKVEEGNAYGAAVKKAKKEGAKEFEFNGETHTVKESKKFTKKQLKENFLNKTINESLNKILNEELLCEQCGKIHEGPCSSHIDEDLDINNEREYDTWDDFMSSDFSDSRLDITDRKWFDRYRNKYGRFRVKPEGESYVGTFGPDDNDSPWHSIYEDSDDDKIAGEDVGVVHEQDMDIVDAIATGQNYLQASGDLDRDGDGIPNRLDMDSNMDGDLDHPTFGDDFEEIDIDTLLGNAPAPTTKPGIADPTTTPGKKKPRWKKIPRPAKDPKPKAISERKKATIKRNGMYK